MSKAFLQLKRSSLNKSDKHHNDSTISVRFLAVCPSCLLDLLRVGSISVSGLSLCPFCRPCLPLCASFGVTGHIVAFREPVSLTMNAIKSMRRRQVQKWRPSASHRQQKSFALKTECEIADHRRPALTELFRKEGTKTAKNAVISFSGNF